MKKHFALVLFLWITTVSTESPKSGNDVNRPTVNIIKRNTIIITICEHTSPSLFKTSNQTCH